MSLARIRISLLVILVAQLFSCQNNPVNPVEIIHQPNVYFSKESGWVKLEDGQKMGAYTRLGNQIFCGEVGCRTNPMESVEASEFYVWPGTDYAKDPARVFFPATYTCVCGDECSVCYNSNPQILEADPKTFKCLDVHAAEDTFATYLEDVRTLK